MRFAAPVAIVVILGWLVLYEAPSSLAAPVAGSPPAEYWFEHDPLTIPRNDHIAVALPVSDSLPRGGVLVAGGHYTFGIQRTTEIYDNSSETWTVGPIAPDMSTPRWYHEAVTLPPSGNDDALRDGGVLVVGGHGSPDKKPCAPVPCTPTDWPPGEHPAADTAEYYSARDNTWTLLPIMPHRRRNSFTVTVVPRPSGLGYDVYVIGGRTANYGGSPNDAVSIWHPDSNSWTLDPVGLTQPRTQHTATALPDGRLVVIGGSSTASATSQHTTFEVLDAGVWIAMGPLPRVGGHSAALMSDDQSILVAGGRGADAAPPGSYYLNSYLVDPATGKIPLSESPLLTPRAYHRAATLDDGSVLIGGGCGVLAGCTYATDTLLSAERFYFDEATPSNSQWVNASIDPGPGSGASPEMHTRRGNHRQGGWYHLVPMPGIGAMAVGGGGLTSSASLYNVEVYRLPEPEECTTLCDLDARVLSIEACPTGCELDNRLTTAEANLVDLDGALDRVHALETDVAGLETHVTGLTARLDAAEAELAAIGDLEARVAAMEALLAGASRTGNDLTFTDVNFNVDDADFSVTGGAMSVDGGDLTVDAGNLHVVNGTGSTKGVPNALGNVIIGYDEIRGDGSDDKSGSHMLVIGPENNYTVYGGMAVGERSQVSGAYANVIGGFSNTAENSSAVVIGGDRNVARGTSAIVIQGTDNVAAGSGSITIGGGGNLANGVQASTFGGKQAEAAGWAATIIGGHGNVIPRLDGDGDLIENATILGGDENVANGDHAVAVGGSGNTASGHYAVSMGGYLNGAFGTYSTTTGGRDNAASGPYSGVAGGRLNIADGPNAAVSGGEGNIAGGESSTVSGGKDRHTPVPGSKGKNIGQDEGRYNWLGGKYHSAN